MTTTRNARSTIVGTVVTDKMDKSIGVRVERTFKFPKYDKFVRRHKKYMAHDEQNEARVGDLVELVSTRPISKNKRWRLARVVKTSALGALGTGAEPNSNEAASRDAKAEEAEQ